MQWEREMSYDRRLKAYETRSGTKDQVQDERQTTKDEERRRRKTKDEDEQRGRGRGRGHDCGGGCGRG